MLLGCTPFTDKHTSVNIAKWLQDLLAEWELTYLLDVITTDTAANCLGIYKVPQDYTTIHCTV